ncbi:SEC13-like protein [Mya arenaria]|uniref:Protein SEC13 homolog n=1 Tax=Mya arenaria TaxID=6604 RepID=A0ABY7FYU0_MYAAR|nr:SEC13-like protein [Mya arenaria]
MVSVLNSIDTAHEDMIVFDVKGGQQRLIIDLRGHEGPVWQLAWAHPMYGSLIASCGYDRKVILWKETNGTWGKLYEYSNHDSSGDGCWDAKKIKNAHTIGCNAVSWAPALAPNALLDQSGRPTLVKKLVSGGCDNLDCRVIIWTNDGISNSWNSAVLNKFKDVTSLWKETLEGQWVCISDVKKGQGAVGDGQPARNL